MKLCRIHHNLVVAGVFFAWYATPIPLATAAQATASATAVIAESQAPTVDVEVQETITTQELLALLKAKKSDHPLILNVGPRLLYAQAHIPDAEYIGAGSTMQGIEALRARVKSVSHSSFIVLYCGCCPWDRCPNVRPAYGELHSLGFTKVKLLMLPDNFGTDWVYKGYPTVKGQ